MPRKKTTNKGKTSKKTTKASKLTQTHGKVEKVKPSTLDQVWGDTGLSRYGTASLEEYKDQLRGMNRTDIQAHATRLGIVPVENREMLEKRLTKEFEKHTSSYKTPKSPKQTEVSQEALRILGEGR